ncbi:acyl-[acyl-carrier-protein] desaturase [Allocatelliglobosispora scoriae]|uniref:Acyl-[acyl-carrier-protein] desaturase n=1 Tax=Allocatelliglobosispora scoriae TaxID=643052 RepID=A0A841BQZ1_9ACTN|nr:acyl-ACP desaturase [Allocatelliglobosispora scoriae]MBB5869609.1 acyl-[acyl-carrier-protein] desaturase [Allocatelliglobosispora scoriae]
MTTEITDTKTLLLELEPVVEVNLNRHFATAKEWFPHEYIPWSQGTDYDGVLGGQAWTPDQSKLSDVARTSLIVNLLTEDNLPSYHHEIAALFGRDGAWGTWVHRWTAEEGRHGVAIRDYLTVTRAVDPIALERARMVHMGGGFTSDYDGAIESIAYVSFQELATRVSHRNTGRISGDPVCDQLLAKVAADENLHMLFYRNLLAAAFQLAPNTAMRAITEVVKKFQMPGYTIENFGRKSVQIALAGVYDLRIHHDEVIWPVLRQLGAMEATGLSGDGEAAREELVAYLRGLDEQATRFTERRDALNARKAAL